MPGVTAIRRFRSQLKSGRLCIGAAATFADPLVSDALAGSVDFLWIDLEHSAMSPEALSGHLLAGRARGVPGLVRVTGSGTPCIKPVLDAGADGIIVPQIRSAEEVQSIVADCRYPPLGRRGYGPRVPSNYGRDGGRQYVERANADLFVAVQIETAEALAALDEITAVAGLDSLVLGPWDLSWALGKKGEVDDPQVVAAIDTVIAKAHAAGLSVGSGMGADPAYACFMAQRGVQWIQFGSDYDYLVKFVTEAIAHVRSRLSAGSVATDAKVSTPGLGRHTE